jgi:hypothetical protein
VESGLPALFAVPFVQAAAVRRMRMPLVMRCWPVSDWRLHLHSGDVLTRQDAVVVAGLSTLRRTSLLPSPAFRRVSTYQAKVSLGVVRVVRFEVPLRRIPLLRSVTATSCALPSAWTGSWTGAPNNPSAVSAVNAMTCVICAASAPGAWGRTSRKRQVSGSNPLTGSQVRWAEGPPCGPVRGTICGTNVTWSGLTSRDRFHPRARRRYGALTAGSRTPLAGAWSG